MIITLICSALSPISAQITPLSQTERQNVELVISNLHHLTDSLGQLKTAAKNARSAAEYENAQILYQNITRNIEHKLSSGQIASVPDLDDKNNKKYRHDGQAGSPKAAYCGDGKTQVKDAAGNWIDCPQGTILVDKKIIDPINGTPIDESTQDGWQKKWNLAHVLVHEKAHEIMIQEQVAELTKQRWWNELPQSEKTKRINIATGDATTADKHVQVYLVQKNLLKAYKESLKDEKKQVSDEKKSIRKTPENRERIRQLDARIAAIDDKIKWLDDTWRDLQGAMRQAVRGSEFGHEHCGWPMDFHSGTAAIMVTFPAGYEQFNLSVKNDDVTDVRITKTQWYGEKINIDSESKKPSLYIKMPQTVFSGQFIQPEVCEYLDWAENQGLVIYSKNPIPDEPKTKKSDTKSPYREQILTLYGASLRSEKVSSILIKINDQEIKSLRSASSEIKSVYAKTKSPDAKILIQQVDVRIKDAESDKKDIAKLASTTKKTTQIISKIALKEGIKKSDLDKSAKTLFGSGLGGTVSLGLRDAAKLMVKNWQDLSPPNTPYQALEVLNVLASQDAPPESILDDIDVCGPDTNVSKDQPKAPPESILDDIDVSGTGSTPRAVEIIDGGVLRGFTLVEGGCDIIGEHVDESIDRPILIQVFGHVNDSRPKMDLNIITSESAKPVIQKEPTTKPSETTSNTKPTLSIPKQMTQEATDSSGATVFYNPTGQDKEDGTIIPTCEPKSGSTFPIGTTTVICTVKDSKNNSVSGTFTVTVRDTTPPSIPAFQPREGVRDETGVQVFFDVTAHDLVDGDVPANCNYPSGYKFPIGTTVLTCTADDSRGNHASRSLQITVTVTESGQ